METNSNNDFTDNQMATSDDRPGVAYTGEQQNYSSDAT